MTSHLGKEANGTVPVESLSVFSLIKKTLAEELCIQYNKAKHNGEIFFFFVKELRKELRRTCEKLALIKRRWVIFL